MTEQKTEHNRAQEDAGVQLVALRADRRPPVRQTRSRRSLLSAGVGGGASILAGVGIWLAIRGNDKTDDPGMLFVIPPGAGEAIGNSTLLSAIEMPTQIRFERGQTAAITISNEDDVVLRAGPFLVGPGQRYTQRFPNPGEYPIACTVDLAESITVTVV